MLVKIFLKFMDVLQFIFKIVNVWATLKQNPD